MAMAVMSRCLRAAQLVMVLWAAGSLCSLAQVQRGARWIFAVVVATRALAVISTSVSLRASQVVASCCLRVAPVAFVLMRGKATLVLGAMSVSQLGRAPRLQGVLLLSRVAVAARLRRVILVLHRQTDLRVALFLCLPERPLVIRVAPCS